MGADSLFTPESIMDLAKDLANMLPDNAPGLLTEICQMAAKAADIQNDIPSTPGIHLHPLVTINTVSIADEISASSIEKDEFLCSLVLGMDATAHGADVDIHLENLVLKPEEKISAECFSLISLFAIGSTMDFSDASDIIGMARGLFSAISSLGISDVEGAVDITLDVFRQIKFVAGGTMIGSALLFSLTGFYLIDGRIEDMKGKPSYTGCNVAYQQFFPSKQPIKGSLYRNACPKDGMSLVTSPFVQDAYSWDELLSC